MVSQSAWTAVRINRAISDDIRVTSLDIVPEGFDAHFSALRRRYSYRVCENPLDPNPLARDVSLPWYRTLHLDRMNEGVAAMAQHPQVLEEVGYPTDDELQAREDLTRARRSLGEESTEGSPDGSGDQHPFGDGKPSKSPW